MKDQRHRSPRSIDFIKEPFGSAVKDYIADTQAANLSGWSVFTYVEGLRCFFLWLETAYPSAKHFSDLSRQVLSDYQMHLWKAENKKGGKLSAATHEMRLSAVLRFLSFLHKTERILINPAAGFQTPKRPKRLPRNYLSQREVNKLLRAVEPVTYLSLRNRAILETMYSTGIRNAELRNLKLEDLNWNDGYLTIRAGKGAKDRVVPVGKAALHFIAAYLEKSRPALIKRKQTDLLFVSRHGERLHQDSLNHIVCNAAKAAKIKHKVTAHSLRHTCATLMLKGRADIRHIQELLGHRSLASTQIYTKVEIADLKRIHQLCHPREREAIDKK